MTDLTTADAQHTPDQKRAMRCLDESLADAKKRLVNASIYARNAGVPRREKSILRMAEQVERLQAAIAKAGGAA